MDNKENVVIYHGGCDDGFAAAYAIWKAHPEWTFHPGSFREPPPDVTGKHVWLVDFSYKRPVIERMLDEASSVAILDHHKTAEEDLRPLLHEGRLKGKMDLDRCGAFIAWEAFHGLANMPNWFPYIQDRDLWLKKLPLGDQVTMAIRSYPQEFAIWDAFDVARLAQEGQAIHRYYRLRVEEVKRLARIVEWKPYGLVQVANCPYFLASEVAGEFCEATDLGVEFGAAWYQHGDGSKTFSLRSRGEFDVSKIAVALGGGGHKHAAGFTLPAPCRDGHDMPWDV